jgi:hypothetical protein
MQDLVEELSIADNFREDLFTSLTRLSLRSSDSSATHLHAGNREIVSRRAKNPHAIAYALKC